MILSVDGSIFGFIFFSLFYHEIEFVAGESAQIELTAFSAVLRLDFRIVFTIETVKTVVGSGSVFQNRFRVPFPFDEPFQRPECRFRREIAADDPEIVLPLRRVGPLVAQVVDEDALDAIRDVGEVDPLQAGGLLRLRKPAGQQQRIGDDRPFPIFERV